MASSFSSSSSLLDLLLSPFHLDDELTADSWPPGPDALSPARSFSNESIPSLAQDDDDSLLSISQFSPSTFELDHSPREAYRHVRTVSSSPREDCLENHPLVFSKCEERWRPSIDAALRRRHDMRCTNKPPPMTGKPARRGTRSSLTASLRVLRSAAWSLSNFSAPVVQPDYLARSISSISPQFTSERRLLPMYDTPTPALRRYLNPLPWTSAALKRSIENLDDRHPCAIQLQTYSFQAVSPLLDTPPTKPGTVTTVPPGSQDITPIASPRPREIRENSDFLRIVVLEMRMRKAGKLSETAPGRARFILPPRQPGKTPGRDPTNVGRSRWIDYETP